MKRRKTMSHQGHDILSEKYYQEYLDEGYTPAEAEKLTKERLENES